MKKALMQITAVTAAVAFLTAIGVSFAVSGMELYLQIIILVCALVAVCALGVAASTAVSRRMMKELSMLTSDDTAYAASSMRYEELESIAKKLTEQKARILSQEHIKQEFTANVSHELKTPLTSISGYAEMIATGMAKPDDVSDFAHRIQKEARRLLTLISDIIKLSELDETDKAESMEPVDLKDIVTECSEILYNSAAENDIDINIVGGNWVVQGNHTLLTELVFNLMDNAIRYNRNGGSITVTVGDGVLSVRDTGIGIPSQHFDRIFERFYRVDKSRSKATGGTGLGLAIVKHVAEQHGARISIDSEEGKCTLITINFNESKGATDYE